MQDLISHVYEREINGGAVLEALLRDTVVCAPLLQDVNRNDLLVTAIWYIWWERRKASHGEMVQSPPRTSQAISALAMNYSRERSKGRVLLDTDG